MQVTSSCICILAIGIIAANAAASGGKSYRRFENINVDGIIGSDRLLKAASSCVLDLGPCSGELIDVKSTIPEAIQNNCDKCSEKLRANIFKLIYFLRDHRPEVWKQVVDKYDPTGRYADQYSKKSTN